MSTCLAVAKEQIAGSPVATSAPVAGEAWQSAAMDHILGVQHLHHILLLCPLRTWSCLPSRWYLLSLGCYL